MNKPTGRYKCNACGLIWDGSQLYQDPDSTAVRWTCGDLSCGASVREIAPATAPQPRPDTAAPVAQPAFEPTNWGPPGFAKNRERRRPGR